MHLLLSGEGSSDIGACESSADSCDKESFKVGPMALVIDQLVEVFLGYEFSHIDSGCATYVSESFLAANRLPPTKKSVSMPGKKKPKETKYFYENARVMARYAKQKALELNDTVIAVLFRDGDGTASAGRGEWSHKKDSMHKGFEVEVYELGVPMIPKPKSEAWLLCAVKDNPYQGCEKLENESGNDNSANPLKDQLSASLNGKTSTNNLNDMIRNHCIDVQKISMPSFVEFKQSLQEAITKALATGSKQ